MDKIPEKMKGAFLPGNSTVEFKEYNIPKLGYGEVLIKTKASTICGSDIRCIYNEHLGKGPEAYQPEMVAGHEPAGQVIACGDGMREFKPGDRVVIYHISGCGVCNDCRRGYQISCTSEEYRKAYGWQRNGGMAPYIVAEEKDLVHLPDYLSYTDGAQVACGFGTVYEGLEKIGISGNDAVLITGLGPVGLAGAMLCRCLGAKNIIGIEANPERVKIAKELPLRKGDTSTLLFDSVLTAGPDNVDEVRRLTNGHGCERSVECSANENARLTCIQATRKWGKIVLIGEGNGLSPNFAPSRDMIHDQKTLYGSWVTNVWRMDELLERLARWEVHPADLVSHRFSLEEAPKAYELMAAGKCGKVAVCFDEELNGE
ncbi:MAG: zinc-binding dehydrogenase [Pontiellaceae bacterium]